MAAVAGSAQAGALERAFTQKKYKLGDPSLVARAQQLAQQLHISFEAFANHYDSYALVSDWNMDVTAQRLKMVADYLEGEQRKENAKPRAAGASGAGLNGVPQAMRPTWEDLPDKLDYPTPSAKRQALDPAAVNPGTAPKTGGTGAFGIKPVPAGGQSQPRGTPGAATTPLPAGQAAPASQAWAATPLTGAAAGTPAAPPTAFAQRSNRGQVVASLNDHLPGPAAHQQRRSAGGVIVRPVGQPPLDGGEHLFMMEVLDTKHSVADVSQQPVWVAGRVLPEAEGGPLHPEGMVLEGCREASGGARVKLDVSCLPSFRLFPGQSVCAFGLNPTGSTFVAQRLVTHVPPPPLAAAASGASDAGMATAAAARESGLSLVVAAGPFSLTEDMSYSPLDELLSYCSATPPDVLLLLGPFVDSEAPGLASGSADRTADALLREEVLRRLAAWRSGHGATTLALMPAVRDATAVPVLPQPPMTAAAALVGPAEKVVALQNPATAAVGPLLLAAGASDLLKGLSASEVSRVPPGTAVERLPALASHVLGQRSLYPLYPAPLGTCLDTSHYTQLQLPVCPDLLLLPSDLAPFAKLLPPAAWEAGAPPAGAAAPSAAAPVVVLNPGRLSKGAAGGTFAHVVVAPGSGALADRMRVEVKRV
ncbi:hypothetical protein GPECTOR_25g336 [Gonium pectorale]|uniref:DNA polymerase alpha subunit B n=1 Tax=Gonium pectorale TaxID=33097 RepID=A0A150GFZ2_GONPE|nr:hypothetical protein GPECTOR_25g336 [Gonium pectorale]|eukprot:KXZ48752.1 hypothetical protein GPECTOR_25g336 [Gonium pectorale]